MSAEADQVPVGFADFLALTDQTEKLESDAATVSGGSNNCWLLLLFLRKMK